MIFRNALIFDDCFKKGGFRTGGGRIREIFTEAECPREGIDLHGAYVLPGLLDIHTHGNSGWDFSDGSAEGLRTMARYYAVHGVTSFAPTMTTVPKEQLELALRRISSAGPAPFPSAKIAGIRLEGPYLSSARKGAQNEAFLRLPDIGEFLRLQSICGNTIRMVDVAPELDGAMDFISAMSAQPAPPAHPAPLAQPASLANLAHPAPLAQPAFRCRISAAHTAADYETASKAFDTGITHVTHLYNGMTPFHQREPGLIGAAAERSDVTAELICDGLHCHPSAVRMAFRLFPDRICLISDSLRCCGMPDGKYELGGQDVYLKEGAAYLSDGTLAGAASNLFEDLRNAVRFGISLRDAVLAATLTPARVIGLDSEIGSLEPGKSADFLICSPDLKLIEVYIDGRKVGV